MVCRTSASCHDHSQAASFLICIDQSTTSPALSALTAAEPTSHGGITMNDKDQKARVPAGLEQPGAPEPRTPLVAQSARPRVPRRPATLLRLATAMLIAIAGVTLAAAPAHAATPACDTYGWFWPGNTSGITLKLPVDTDLGVAYGEWRCTMRYTNTGEDVRTLQEGLNVCYGTNTGTNLGISLRLDGQFGPATRAALVKVQQHHHISADGIYGPQTARTILHKGRMTTPYGIYDVCATTAQAGVS